MFLVTDALVLALRAVSFVALFQAAGTALFVVLNERGLSVVSAERIRTLGRLAALVALVAAVLQFVLTPARMAGDFAGALDPSLQSLLLQSNAGVAQIVRVVGLALLLLALDRASRLNDAAALVGAGLALVSFVLMGHTAIHPLRMLMAALLLVHVGVAAYWFGALEPLRITVAGEAPARSGAVVARFSHHALRLVPAILVCGIAMSVVFVRSWAELATPYGALLLGKGAAFAALMALAARNKWQHGPRLSAGDLAAAAALRRTAAIEWWLIAGVLVATAVMTTLYSPEHLEGAFGGEHADEPLHE